MKLYPENLNRRYDAWREPRRFLTAMTMLSPAFILTSLPFWVQMASLFWLGTIGFLRAAYLCRLEYHPPR